MNKFNMIKRFLLVILLTIIISNNEMSSLLDMQKKESSTRSCAYKMGLSPITKENYDLCAKTNLEKSIEYIDIKLPSKMDLSADFPTPGNQGKQQSCVGWSVGYANKSYQERREHHSKFYSSKNLCSPSYIYNQINGGIDEGASLKDALQIVVEQGACSMKDMPYKENDYISKPTDLQKNRAGKFKAKDWFALDLNNIDIMKVYLLKGDAVVIGFPVFADFYNMNYKKCVWNTYSGRILGYHSVCVVGYDDNKKAFKIINSWGTKWGKNGYGWISYDMMKLFCIEAYVLNDIIENVEKEKISESKFEVKYNCLEKWDEGVLGNIEIENLSTKEIGNICLEFDYDEVICAFLNAEIISHKRNHYRIKVNENYSGEQEQSIVNLLFVVKRKKKAKLSRPYNFRVYEEKSVKVDFQ